MKQTKLALDTTETSIRAACAESGSGAFVYFLDILADEMNQTADHVRSNWQDESLAKVWERIARRLEEASSLANTL